MNRLSFLCFLLALCFVGCGKSEGSLGTFKGSMNDLPPKEICWL